MKSGSEIINNIPEILKFIKNYIYDDEIIVVPVSGGLDSDVTARLCKMAVGSDKLHLFIVKQSGMDEKYLKNAYDLAEDIESDLAVINLGDMNVKLIDALSRADKKIKFDINYILDTARAYCSLRSAIISSYQDKGCIIASNTNRTEKELGFFMPFGDNLGHIKPLEHLYKTEVKILASFVGTRQDVMEQAPSAAFWEDENDLEDIAYWIYNKAPVMCGRTFTEQETQAVTRKNRYAARIFYTFSRYKSRFGIFRAKL